MTDQTGDMYEDVVTFACRRGYHRMRGSELRTCLGDGTWSGTPLVCAGMSCIILTWSITYEALSFNQPSYLNSSFAPVRKPIHV